MGAIIGSGNPPIKINHSRGLCAAPKIPWWYFRGIRKFISDLDRLVYCRCCNDMLIINETPSKAANSERYAYYCHCSKCGETTQY